jgi:hypothetical protein
VIHQVAMLVLDRRYIEALPVFALPLVQGLPRPIAIWMTGSLLDDGLQVLYPHPFALAQVDPEQVW